jgi:hypothetical protein
MLCTTSGKVRDQKPNRLETLTSPSGKYILTVPIERSNNLKGPLGFGMPFRHVTISDPNGDVIFRDPDEEFSGVHKVYWIWDVNDRVWLYGSESGSIYYWEYKENKWAKSYWGDASPWSGVQKDNEVKLDISPPDDLYPDYIKETKKGSGF